MAASAAASMALGVSFCPRRAASASAARMEVRPTHPRMMRASLQVSRSPRVDADGGAGRGVDRRTALKGDERAAAAFRRGFHRDFVHEFAGGENGGVSVGDKVGQCDRARAIRSDGVNFGVEGKKNRAPVAARVGFCDGAADRATIAHLHVGDSCGAIVQNGDFAGGGGILDIGVARHGTEMQRTVAALDVREARDEIQIHER